MEDTARSATGLVAFPDTPPYVVSLSIPTAGHGSPREFNPIKPDIVFIADTPSALPKIFVHNILFIYRLVEGSREEIKFSTSLY